jgi:hypothetical protein
MGIFDWPTTTHKKSSLNRPKIDIIPPRPLINPKSSNPERIMQTVEEESMD